VNEVEVHFKGGSQKSYVLTFEDEDLVSIHAGVKSGNKPYRRLFWHRDNAKPLSNLGLVVVGKAQRDKWVPGCG